MLVGISIFWVGLSFLTDGFNSLVLPSHLAKIYPNRPATAIGLVSFVGLIAGMLLQPLAGAWSDHVSPRFGRRRAILSGTVVALVGLAMFSASNSLWTVMVAFVILHAGAAIAQAAQQGFIPDLVKSSNRGLAAGIKGLMDVGGAAVGFIVLGQLLSSTSLTWASVATGGVLVLALAFTFLLVREPIRDVFSESRPSFFHMFHIDLRQERDFLRLVGARFLFLLATFTVGRFLLLLVDHRLRLSSSDLSLQTGMLLGALALLTALAALPAGWAADRFGRVRLMRLGCFSGAIGALGFAFADSILQFYAAGSFLALGSASFGAANWAMTADVVPVGQGGRYFGLANLGTAGAAAVAGLFGPGIDLGNRIRPGSGYSVVMASCVVLFLLSIRFTRIDAAAVSAADVS